MAGPASDSEDAAHRLSQIATDWSMLLQAHENSETLSGQALETLLHQYRVPVYRYLLGASRDPDVAQELSHEFVVRLLRGDFHRANPDRGPFRRYLKTVLINLVNDHFRKENKQPHQFGTAGEQQLVSPENDDLSFEQCLQTELLNAAWQSLEAANTSYYRVLLTRVEQPDLSAQEILEHLGLEMTAATVRKTLERARTKFADLLLEQACTLLEWSTREQLEAELKEVGLLGYCQSALDRMSF